jgi:hypothetical protein
VKHLSADDSGRTSVKVGHRQALTLKTPQAKPEGFCLCNTALSLHLVEKHRCFKKW